MHGLSQWRERWTVAGAAIIPLAPHSKRAVCDGWQFEPPVAQWAHVGPDFRGNIGMRCGGGWFVIDGDNQQATDNVRSGLTGLGLELAEVETPSGGRHFYGLVNGAPVQFNWGRLPVGMGAGELRVNNAYVATPCSEVDHRRYRFLHGNPETIAHMRPVAWGDLTWLVAGEPTVETLERLPVVLVKRATPEKALTLFGLLQRAPKGWPVLDYATRSEAEAAIVAMLALAGWDLPEVSAAFERYKPGHYAEKRTATARAKYLTLTWRKACAMLAATPERMQLAGLYAQAEQASWPGRGGGLERAAYLGVVAIGWQFSTLTPYASERCIAEHAGASRKGINKALKRLQRAERLSRPRWATETTGATWRIKPENAPESAEVAISHILIRCSGELYARHALGSTAAMVMSVLGGGDGARVFSAADLATLTGKHPATIRRVLGKLAEYDLVVSDGGRPERWQRGPRAIADVADLLDVEGHARRRRNRHEVEREIWHERIKNNEH